MLRGLLDRLRSGNDRSALYRRIVAQARQPGFYGGDGVADTPDGRFELIVLHAVLVMRRLRRDGEGGRRAAQELFDLLFADLDRNLREMGVADLGVPKRIRRMAEAFYGRAAAYDQALDGGAAGALEDALARNLYEGRAGRDRLAGMGAYVRACEERLAAVPGERVGEGDIAWPAPPASASGAAV